MVENLRGQKSIALSFFQSFIEALPLAINVISDDLDSIMVNERYMELFSLNLENDFMDSIELAFFQKRQVDSCLFKAQTLKGEKNLEIAVLPIMAEVHVIGAILVIADMTDKIALLEAKARYESVILSLNEQVQALEKVLSQQRDNEPSRPVSGGTESKQNQDVDKTQEAIDSKKATSTEITGKIDANESSLSKIWFEEKKQMETSFQEDLAKKDFELDRLREEIIRLRAEKNQAPVDKEVSSQLPRAVEQTMNQIQSASPDRLAALGEARQEALTDIDILQAEIDYTSRDDDTWLAIRQINQALRSRKHLNIVGGQGIGRRAIANQLLARNNIKSSHYFRLSKVDQVGPIISKLETSHSLAIISFASFDLCQNFALALGSRLKMGKITSRLILLTEEALSPKLLADSGLARDITTIRIPNLKERKADVLLLVNKFLPEDGEITLSDEAKLSLIQYSWPGNIRELKSSIRYALTMLAREETIIDTRHLPTNIFGDMAQAIGKGQLEKLQEELALVKESNKVVALPTNNRQKLSRQDFFEEIVSHMNKSDQSLPEYFDNIEKKLIEETLIEMAYNITHTAKKLGIKRQALQYKIKKYNLVPEDYLEEMTKN